MPPLQVVEVREPVVREVANDFIKFLFTSPGQTEFGKLGFRINPKVSKQAASGQVDLPPASLWNVEKVFGSWDKAQARFFDAGKILDHIQEAIGKRRQTEKKVIVAKKV